MCARCARIAIEAFFSDFFARCARRQILNQIWRNPHLGQTAPSHGTESAGATGRAVKRWEPSAVVHVEHEQQNNSKTSEQQQANVKDFG